MLLCLKWVPSWSISHNTLQRYIAWWSAALTSSPNRSQTSSANLLTRELKAPRKHLLPPFLQVYHPGPSTLILWININALHLYIVLNAIAAINFDLFITAHLQIEKTRPPHSHLIKPQVLIKPQWRPMSIHSCLKDWRKSQLCWSSAPCWMGSLLVLPCCPHSRQSTRWAEWKAMGWLVWAMAHCSVV